MSVYIYPSARDTKIFKRQFGTVIVTVAFVPKPLQGFFVIDKASQPGRFQHHGFN
jgi:hypothetical protein